MTHLETNNNRSRLVGLGLACGRIENVHIDALVSVQDGLVYVTDPPVGDESVCYSALYPISHIEVFYYADPAEVYFAAKEAREGSEESSE